MVTGVPCADRANWAWYCDNSCHHVLALCKELNIYRMLYLYGNFKGASTYQISEIFLHPKSEFGFKKFEFVLTKVVSPHQIMPNVLEWHGSSIHEFYSLKARKMFKVHISSPEITNEPCVSSNYENTSVRFVQKMRKKLLLKQET